MAICRKRKKPYIQNGGKAREQYPVCETRKENNALNWGERKFSMSQKWSFLEELRLTESIMIFKKRS